MARYIDAEALTDYMLERYNDLCEKHGDYDHYTTGYGDAIDVIENAPTADVVPKSEVDKTIAEWAYLHADVLNKLENARVEVAREIFEEIEKIVVKVRVEDTKNFVLSEKQFAELKKKYTEKRENNR